MLRRLFERSNDDVNRQDVSGLTSLIFVSRSARTRPKTLRHCFKMTKCRGAYAKN